MPKRDLAAAAADAFVEQTATLRAEIRQGDAFDLATDLAPGSVDLICTSPPYWGLRTYGFEYSDQVLARHRAEGGTLDRPPAYEAFRGYGGVLGLEPSPDWYVKNLVELFERLRPALKLSGSLWVNLGDTYFARWSSIRQQGRQGLGNSERVRRRVPSGGYRHDKQLLLLPARFAIAMQEAGWILRNDLIWAKSHVAPRPEQDRLRLSHEHFFHFVQRRVRARPSYYYDLSAVEEGALDVVHSVPEPGDKGHSATFSTRIIEPRIASSCPPGGLLLDPLCGAGTALTSAIKLGRSALGFELAAPYAEAALKNLTEVAREHGARPPVLVAHCS